MPEYLQTCIEPYTDSSAASFAAENGFARLRAGQTFRQIEGFGSYGFPESHAASFALIDYASSWMKCHHPDVFCAALLNAQPMGFYASAQIVRDARQHGVEVKPIDINHTRWDCTLEKTNGRYHAVRMGLPTRAISRRRIAPRSSLRGETSIM